MNGDELKKIAGETAALKFVKPNDVVGLGTGSTAKYAIKKLGERIRREKISIRGIPTSQESEALALKENIPLISLAEVDEIDVTIDGADEIDSQFQLIKGGGGALLREKMVASITTKEVIVINSGKFKPVLGKEFPLPVEVVQFEWDHNKKILAKLGCSPELRRKNNGEPFVTDNGNYILDCGFDGINNPEELEKILNNIPGIVENGLFIGLAHILVTGTDDGVTIDYK